jgi:YD repeat-containing protein
MILGGGTLFILIPGTFLHSDRQDYQYDYDRMSNITVKATEHGTYQYDYDALDRLIRAENPTQRDEAFTYDSVGNRLTSAGTTGDWTYNPNNELGGYDGTNFLYDANGNTVQKTEGEKVTRYLYNAEDRLVRVEDGSGHVIAEYDYDPFGRRLWKLTGKGPTSYTLMKVSPGSATKRAL